MSVGTPVAFYEYVSGYNWDTSLQSYSMDELVIEIPILTYRVVGKYDGGVNKLYHAGDLRYKIAQGVIAVSSRESVELAIRA